MTEDREFSGEAFARWLLAHGIPFVLRVRGNVGMTDAQGRPRYARELFAGSPVGEARELGKRRVFRRAALPLFVSGVRAAAAAAGVAGEDAAGGLVIVVSDQPHDLLGRYAKRWGVETLFGCLKRRGFDLEATHVTAPDRLSRLLGVLALAFCWAYVTGEWLFEQQPWKVKKHGRLMVSLFRRGLDWLQRLLLPLCGNHSQQQLKTAAHFLSCT